jgi:hypothetical protein
VTIVVVVVVVVVVGVLYGKCEVLVLEEEL